MSTKIAVIIGDYSNGWNDAWIIQAATKIKNQETLKSTQPFVMERMSAALNRLISDLEENEAINPTPKDEPCCEGLQATLTANPEMKCCGDCGAKITPERRKRFV